jgi:hypothetical protein
MNQFEVESEKSAISAESAEVSYSIDHSNDCPHYLYTGNCMFKATCTFDHRDMFDDL